ncbi:hypothetical protein BC829DRAFT_280578 [Chytridium lagenaria]|nr:hypothetical protein BC829DRAFT_280578 [Chytridium lagenaria]
MYDCIKTMLFGINEVLQSIPGMSVSNLTNAINRATLLPKIFADTGYAGASSEVISLSDEGDLKVPYLFNTMNRSHMFGFINPGVHEAFGYSSSMTFETMIEIRKPVFFDGTDSPPPSGPVRKIIWISSETILGYILKALLVLVACTISIAMFSLFIAVIKGRNCEYHNSRNHNPRRNVNFIFEHEVYRSSVRRKVQA